MAAEVGVPAEIMAENTADLKHLHNILSAEELSAVSKPTIEKIESYIDVKFEEFLTSKALFEAGRRETGEKIEKLENEVCEITSNYEHCKAKLDATEQNLQELEAQLGLTKSELLRTQESLHRMEGDVDDFRRQRNSAVDERDGLNEMLDRRNTELERLRMDLSAMSQRLEKAINDKCEALCTSNEIQNKEISLKFKEQHMEQERILFKSQIHSLNEELTRCNEELQTIRFSQANRILALESQLEEKTEALTIADDKISSLNDAKRSLINKNELLTQKLLDQHEMEESMCQNYKKEIETKSKLAELYKSMQDDAEAKTAEVTDGITELQKMLNEALEKYGELETKHKQLEVDHEDIVEKKNETITSLKQELEHANDLLQGAKNESITQALEHMSPTAAVTSRLIRSGMSLTQIYTQLCHVSDELSREKEEKKRLSEALTNVYNELSEKAPLLEEQQMQYEEAMQSNAGLTQQFDSLVTECNQIRDEYAEAMKVSNHFQRENDRLKRETADLARQVCYLLKEVELGKGTSVPSGDQDFSATTTNSTASSSEHSSSRVISKHLVTFGDIQELQATNQKLLKTVRDLSDKQEESERQKVQFEIGEMQGKYETIQNRVTELTEERDRQTKMVTNLIRQRDMYKKQYLDLVKGHGQDVSMNLDRSDGSMDLNESNIKPMVSTPQAPEKPSEIEPLKSQLVEVKALMEKKVEEYKIYKEETVTNQKMLMQQIEDMRKELTDLSGTYSKTVAQLEFVNEKHKTVQLNVTTYKKQIATLEQKCNSYNNTIGKHEISIKHLREEAMNAQSKLSKSEVLLQNLQREYNHLKNTETRLQTERDLLKQERQSQSVLLNNLELIKASLERCEGESRVKLESRLDDANREIASLRRSLQEEQNRFRELASHLEKQTEHAKSRMEEEKSQADKLRVELSSLREELVNKTSHIEEISKKFATAINPTRFDGSFDSVKKLKEVESQLNTKQSEVSYLQQQIEVSKERIKQYCDINEETEAQLKSLHDQFAEYKNTSESKINELLQSETQLREKCSELEAELSLQSDGQHVTTVGLKSELTKAQDSLKSALLEVSEKSASLDLAQSEIAKLAESAQTAEDKYAHEMVLHSNDIQALTHLKEQLIKLQQEMGDLNNAKEQAMYNLSESTAAWEVREKRFDAEKQEIQGRLTDLNQQNALLLDQIQALSTQLALSTVSKNSDNFNESGNASMVADSSMSRSFNEDDVKSSEKLLQIIKYLRKERDIIVAKFDILQAENLRVKSQLDMTEKKLDEAKLTLLSEREKSEMHSVSLSKHSEILRKVETLNAITDSNRILREERDSLVQRVNELSETSTRLEEALAPLQEKNKEFSMKVDTLQSENVALRTEANRWRTRVNALVERANKTSPEDWKRLQNERETLAKMLTTEKDNVKKLNDEMSTLKSEKTRLEEQINTLTKQHISQTDDYKKQIEELNTLKKDMARVTQELGEAKSSLAEKIEELTKITENLAAKEAILLDIRNKEMQIRKIAKKYKSQYEDLTKTVEEDRKKSEMLATEVAMSSESQVEACKELEQKMAELEKSHSEKLAELETKITSSLEEKESLRKENEILKITSGDKEEKAKQVLKQAKVKIVQLTESNDNLANELADIKSKVESAEQNKEESDTRFQLLTSQYEARLSRTEKEKNELQQEKQQEIARLNREVESLVQKVNQLQRQLSSQQAAKPSTSSGLGEKPAGETPTANIKPMAAHSASVSGVVSQQRRAAGETPFASIRPMASHATRTAAVLPTSAQQPPHTTGGVSSGECALSTSPSSSHHTTEYMPASSSARHLPHHPRHPHHTTAPPESTQDMESEVVGGAEVGSLPSQITTQPASTAQSGPQQAVALVMPRMEPPAVATHSHSDSSSVQQPHTLHPHHTHQQQASSSSGGNSSSSTVTTSLGPGTGGGGGERGAGGAERGGAGVVAEGRGALKRPRPAHTLKPPQPKRSRVQQGFQGQVTESEVEYQVPTSSQRDQEDDGVIVVDSEDEEAQYAGNYQEQEMYEEEAEEEEDEDEEEEAVEGGEEEEEEGEEGAEAGEEEEAEEGEDGVEGEEEAEEGAVQHSEVELVEDTSQELPAQSGGDSEAAGGSPAGSGSPGTATPAAPPAPAPSAVDGPQIQAVTSGSQAGSSSLVLGGSTAQGPGAGVYEEGDDGIVPSTPTLYVPRRNDGFGEAVSSPVGSGGGGGVVGRFTFAEGSRSGAGGDSGGGGGAMEDTHADLASQLAPQGDIPSITVTEPSSGAVEGGSGAEVMGGGGDEDTPTVSSQGSQPASPLQQVEEGREAEASPSSAPRIPTPRGHPGHRRPLRHTPRPAQHHRPTPIVWTPDGEMRSNQFMQRGMQRGRRQGRRPHPPFMRF